MDEKSESAKAETLSACPLPAHLRKKRLRRTEAVEYLRLEFGIELAPATLAKWASVGGGPPFQRFNRSPLYPVESLSAWALEKLGRLQASTSDNGESS